MPPWARASGLERELACVASGILPATRVRSDGVLDAADWGTMVHRWKATGEVRAEPGREAHEALFKDRLRRTRIRREDWWPLEGGRHEVAMAVDCDRVGRAAELHGTKEQTEAWRQSLEDVYVAGEADYVGTVLGDPWVDDLKTGRFPPAPSSAQLKVYALCAYILGGGPERVVTSVTHWPRYPRDGLPHRESAHFTARELTAFWKELRLLRRRKLRIRRLPLLDQQANATPGEHCTYCDAAANCTARLKP